MNVFRTVSEYKQFLLDARRKEKRIGFVPTMGYLHEGHLSLIKRAKRENDIVVASVFVNPLQFGPNEDYERYPRDEKRDLQLLKETGADAVFLPSVDEMYPDGTRLYATVAVSGVTERMCGAFRPGHFNGVATVVAKLFHIIGPDRAYFGLKDAQQVAVIERMVRDLHFPVQIVPCPTVREADGLAMSSRNVYLTAEERAQAPVLYKALRSIDGWLAASPRITAKELQAKLTEVILTAPDAKLEYAEVLTYPDLKPIQGPVAEEKRWIAALAVKFGATRLIDNRLFPDEKEGAV